jgi:endoglucanase Acf2
MALYRHHWMNSSSVNTAYTYVSPRGQMQVVRGNSFNTVMAFNGVLPSMPDMGTYNRTTLYNFVNEFYTAGNFIRTGAGTYWTGKDLGRAAMLVRIAEQVGHTAARDALLAAMKTTLQNWLSAPDGEAANMFYYNSNWGTLIGYPAEYGSDVELNDHHFHYGY